MERRENGKKFFLVTKVVDGDTFWINDGTSKGKKIRLIGVDAPESRKTFKKEVGYFGTESKNFLSQLLEGQSVRLVYDIDSTDQYGRTLAYVFLRNGKFVNAELIKNGYATVMTIPPNVKYAEYFVKMAQSARINKKGLWNQQN